MNLLPFIFSFCAGFILGCIILSILLMFVFKEGDKFLTNHHIHHHGEDKNDTYDECE